MENICGLAKEDDEKMDMPPGFRFHPTDEELISHYLYKKVLDINFSARAIGDVDLNKSEPWELPWKAKMGEKEWYFFCVRDRKYPTGLRTNRATEAELPKGEKTNWVMHEYRLEGKFAVHNLPKTAKNEWVICRVFQKSSAGKKTYISGLVRPGSFGSEFSPSGLPPLTDSSPYNGNVNFFKPVRGSVSIQDHSVLKSLIENQGSNMKHQISKPERDMASASQDSATDMNTEISSVISNLEVGNRSFDEQEVPPSTLVQSMDLYCFWNY
ncbi:hypothetical protein OIU77_000932 [Salix suchowensis]|uniref:NAC domain-containing protein n=1 Tax=Salix suchowensis TaxID=1278906 RepID=A0ABQ9B7U7_9ROSI|nr:hypothetical protein OIU77_000932 [Salix suchowensis]